MIIDILPHFVYYPIQTHLYILKYNLKLPFSIYCSSYFFYLISINY